MRRVGAVAVPLGEMRRSLMARVCSAALVAVVVGLVSPARAAPSAGPKRQRLGPDATFVAPGDLAREASSLGPRGDMVTLTDGGDVLVLVVYRPVVKGSDGIATRAPSAAEALRVHAGELARVLGVAPEPSQTRALELLGRARATLRVSVPTEDPSGAAREGWIVAAEGEGRTVVAVALHLVGSPNARPFEAIVGSLVVGGAR